MNEKAGFTFADALRSLLRQDPDILMVGEIRDAETAKLATQAALTGHLVLSTLHTNDAAGAITRLFNLGIEPYLVGATVGGRAGTAAGSQALPELQGSLRADVNERRQIEKLAGDVETLYRPKGCPRCRNLGFSGRIGIYELFVPDDALFERISQGASLNELREAGQRLGLKPLRMDGIEKVKSGITTLDEVYRVTA